MNWLNQTRLVGLREQLSASLLRVWVPCWAVVQTDLNNQLRGWMLRSWFGMTSLAALVLFLRMPTSATPADGGISGVLPAHWFETAAQATMLELLLWSYLIFWPTLVIVLTAGTISSELGVVADSVLSRGISRWQYLVGKWISRSAGILGGYLIVAGVAAAVIWWQPPPPSSTGSPVLQASGTSLQPIPSSPTGADSAIGSDSTFDFFGSLVAIGRVGAVVSFVITLGVAASAFFGSTLLSVAVLWVSVYSLGTIVSLLEIERFSVVAVGGELRGMIGGHYLFQEQILAAGSWLAASLLTMLVTNLVFSRRDV